MICYALAMKNKIKEKSVKMMARIEKSITDNRHDMMRGHFEFNRQANFDHSLSIQKSIRCDFLDILKVETIDHYRL